MAGRRHDCCLVATRRSFRNRDEICTAITFSPVVSPATGRFELPVQDRDACVHAKPGPTLCVDEAHQNFHTTQGRCAPFATLMRDDGFRVKAMSASFTGDAMDHCDVLVIANPLSSENADRTKRFPHASAFTQDELGVLYRWIDDSGSLVLIADHPPFSPAVAGLTAMLGAVPVHTSTVIPGETDVFRRSDGSLREHAITAGRTSAERIDSVATFSGSAFFLSDAFEPLLVLGPNAYGITYLRKTVGELPKEKLPRYELSGWAQAGVRDLGRGRVALVGEASMCTAQSDQHGPFDMTIRTPRIIPSSF